MSLLFVRSLFITATFFGLCAGIRARFDVHYLIAPAVAASGIIAILMFAGMTGLLKAGLIALYALGLTSLAYAFIIKKMSPPPKEFLLVCTLFVAFLIWRFHLQRSTHTDDFNHWGLVARHLLLHDRFPCSIDDFVRFQSYPLGIACFIYFIAKPFGAYEGLYFITYGLLQGILFLPVFSLIKANKRTLYPVAAALFLLLFSNACNTYSLQVDMTLAFWGIGMAASVAYYRDDFNRALIASIFPMIAVTYCKNSGMFFAICTTLMLIDLAKRNRRGSKRLYIALIVLPLVCYLIWTISIKIHFPAPLHSKHSISPRLYLENMNNKGLGGMLKIALAMLHAFFWFYPVKTFYLCIAAILLLLQWIVSRRLAPEQRKKCLYADLFSFALYLAWYILLYFMYIFSMPSQEAVRLASFQRYDSSEFSYVCILWAIVTLLAFQHAQPLARFQRLGARAILAVSATAVLLLAVYPNSYVPFTALYKRDGNPQILNLRDQFERLRKDYDLPTGGNYLIYSDVNYDPHFIFRYVEYELESGKLYQICRTEEHPDQFFAGYREIRAPAENVQEILANTLDVADALLIFDGSEEFEAALQTFLSSHTVDTLIHYIYTN